MDDERRSAAIERLRTELGEAEARKTALVTEAQNFAARIPEIRAAFGNPFFYSHPEDADESAAHYTGFSSHDVLLPTAMSLRRVDRQIRRIKDELLALGEDVDTPT
jgi:hypothetical protein